MKYLLKASGENLLLAKFEAMSLAKVKQIKQDNNLLVINSKDLGYKRLAYTKKVYKLLFKCDKNQLINYVKRYEWKKVCGKTFYVKSYHAGFSTKTLANLVGEKLGECKVCVTNPQTQIEFCGTDASVYCGILLWQNKEKFSLRKPHKRPGFCPVSLSPKLARALVNLSQAKNMLFDPFCGAGGILIEAGLMGLKVVGNDIDKRMLKLSETNLKHFKIKRYKLLNKDATKLKLSNIEAIASDLPYGRSSSLKTNSIKQLAESFLENVYQQLKHGAKIVIVLPNKVNIKTKFKIDTIIDYYVHRSLTRTIYVLSK